MKKILLLLAVGLTLAGCETTKSVFEGGLSLTAPIAAPVGRKELAATEAAYRVAVSAAVGYRRLGLCLKGTTESVQNLCARRDVVLALQQANVKARGALTAARNFVRNNPTISAVSAVGAAKQAVADFQAVLAQNGVR